MNKELTITEVQADITIASNLEPLYDGFTLEQWAELATHARLPEMRRDARIVVAAMYAHTL